MPPLLVRVDAALKAAKLAFTSGRGLDYGRDWEYTPKLWGPGYRGNWGLAGDYDPEKAAGILAFNSIVQACTAWMQRTYPEPRLKVERRQVDEWKEVHGHPLTRLLARPNPFYAGGQLWQRTLADWVPTGNAYWVKIRDGTGKPIQLWHRPECTFRPDWPKDREDVFISQYVQKGKEGKETPWPVEDVVHFRFGYDPANERLGWSPLRAGLNEIGALNTGGRYRGGLLFNKGMPAHSLTPTDPETARELMGKEQSWFDGIRARFNQLFGGSGAGGLFIPSFAAKLERVGFSPAELDIISMLGWDADIVCALLGLNSMVVNLPSGAGQRTYANQADAREAAFECLPADARVWTPSGSRRIEDIQAGDSVWAFEDGKVTARPVTATARMGEKPIYEVRTVNRCLRASGDHRVLTRAAANGAYRHDAKQGTYAWKRVRDLTVMDMLVEPRSLPDVGGTTLPDGASASTDLLQFLGAFVGDGCYHCRNRGLQICMPESDRTREHYAALAPRLFRKMKRGAHRRLAPLGPGETATEPVRVVPGYNRFVVPTSEGAEQVQELGFAEGARRKRVPGWVFGLNRELRLAFLAGIVDSDGSISQAGRLTVCFANHDLMLDIRDLLVSVGIQCGAGYRSVISNAHFPAAKTLETEVWTLSSSSSRVAEIPFADPLYRERLAAASRSFEGRGGDAAAFGLSEDLGFYKIKSIQELPAEPVYDIAVEGAHSFIADGVVVHNCNIIPCQGANAEDLTLQLLPDFERDPENFRVAWDYSKVRVLQGDVNRERTIHLIAQKQRVLTTTEARSLGWSLQPLDEEQKAEIEGESALPSVALSGTVPGQEAPGTPPGSLPAGGVPPALPESTGDRRAASQGQPFSRNGALRQAQGAGKALKAGHAGYVVPEIDPGEIAAAEFAGLDAWFEARRERWKGEVGSEE